MKEMYCKCGRVVQVSDNCIDVQCSYCCHNKIAEQLQEEIEEQPKKKTSVKKLKKYKCARYNVKKTKTGNKCTGCKFKSGCELWALRSK